MTVIPQHVSEFLDNFEGPTLATYPGPPGASRMNSRQRTLLVSDVRALLNELRGLKQALADGPPPLTVVDADEADELPAGTVLQDDLGDVWFKEPLRLEQERRGQFDWLGIGRTARYTSKAISYPAQVMST